MRKKIEINFTEGEGIDRLDLTGTVILKRLNFSEKNAMEEEATEIKIFGKTPQVKISTSKLKEIGLLKSIVKSDLIQTTYVEDKVTKNAVPISNKYDLNMSGIQNLPQEVGEQLVDAFTELNSMNEKKN